MKEKEVKMSQPKITLIDYDLREHRRSMKLELEKVPEKMREELEKRMDKYSTRGYIPLSWQKKVRETVLGTERPYEREVRYFRAGDKLNVYGKIGGPYHNITVSVKSATRGLSLLWEIMEMDFQLAPEVGKAVETIRDATQCEALDFLSVRGGRSG